MTLFGRPQRQIVLQADLTDTNRQLGRLVDLLERFFAEEFGFDQHASTADMTEEELERTDSMSETEQEFLAAIEELEEQGVPPALLAGAYKRLGLKPPVREDEPTKAELESDQPRAAVKTKTEVADDGPPTALRTD